MKKWFQLTSEQEIKEREAWQWWEEADYIIDIWGAISGYANLPEDEFSQEKS